MTSSLIILVGVQKPNIKCHTFKFYRNLIKKNTYSMSLIQDNDLYIFMFV